MSFVVQYVQLVVKLNGKNVTILFFPEPNSYVMFNRAVLLSIDIGSFAVRQVRAGNKGSLQGS